MNFGEILNGKQFFAGYRNNGFIQCIATASEGYGHNAILSLTDKDMQVVVNTACIIVGNNAASKVLSTKITTELY